MSELELTAGQYKGLELAKRLSKEKRAVGVICGFAGVGKTTLLKTLAQDMAIPPLFLTPTGKAASRLTEVTGFRAGTIHRWLYKVEGKAGDSLVFRRKNIDEIAVPESNLVCIDEGSMIQRDVWNDLQEMSAILGFSILIVGDGFQLPPVQEKDEPPFSVMEPDFVRPENRVEMTEILRQAKDSAIIRASLALREGDLEALIDLDHVLPEEVDDEMIKADAIICRTNAMRHHLNARCRHLRGYDGDLQPHEPLLVMKNNYWLGIYNGEVYPFTGWTGDPYSGFAWDFDVKAKVPVSFRRTEINGAPAILAPQAVIGALDKLGRSVERAAGTQNEKNGFFAHMNYGYALSCWKAQGSEWPYVLIGLEKFNYSSLEGRRFMYTAITRAQKKVAITYLPEISQSVKSKR